MGFSIQGMQSIPGGAVVALNEGASEEMWESDRNLYKTEDGRIVQEGHPDSRFLYATPGVLVPVRVAVKLGLLEPRAIETDRERKIRQNHEDKMRTLRDQHQVERERLAARQAAERTALDQTGELPSPEDRTEREKAQPERPQRSKPATTRTKDLKQA